jgi:hypothetical protein
MKIRNGFVSNSSSASFTLRKGNLTKEQIWMVNHHILIGGLMGMEWAEAHNAWELDEDFAKIEGRTDMTNFSMDEFFEKIGIDRTDYEFYGD